MKRHEAGGNWWKRHDSNICSNQVADEARTPSSADGPRVATSWPALAYLEQVGPTRDARESRSVAYRARIEFAVRTVQTGHPSCHFRLSAAKKCLPTMYLKAKDGQ